MAVTSVQFKGFLEGNDRYDREILPILEAETSVGKTGERITITPHHQIGQKFSARQVG
jgi:hypothetical protein